MASRIILIRHGETVWSISKQHTSSTDLELTENGRAIASKLALEVSKFHIAAIYSSPRKRAVDTARLAFGANAHITVTEDIREWEYGDYEGITSADIRKTRPSWSLWTDGAPNGESPEEVSKRADEFLASISQVEGDVAVVAHGHILRVLAIRYVGLPVSDGSMLKLDTATIGILSYEHGRPAIERWNTPVTHV